MKIPFIQHKGIGLHITRRAIRWVELSRIGNTIKVQNVDVEEVEDDDVESSLEALAERQNPSFPYVTVNIDSSHIRQQLLDLPDFDDSEYFNHWIEEQTERLIPEGLNRENFVSNYHLFGREEEQKCLIVVTKKEAIEDRKELLKTVGLKASIITTGQLQAGYGFIFSEDFVTGPARLVSIFEDGASLQYYGDGLLENYLSLSHSDASTSDIIEEAKTYLLTDGTGDLQNQSIYLIESKFNDEKASSSVSNQSIGEVHLEKPLSSLSSSEELSADYSIAAGMVVKQLYPALDTINLVDNESQKEIKDEIDKEDAVHTGILLGGLVVFTFLALMVTQFLLNSSLEEANQEVALLQDDINTVNVATERVKELKQQASQARKLVAERTSMAKTLELVGKSSPARVWFSEVKLNKSKGGKEAAIYGYAHNDALIASLMERLEKESSTDNVRLIFSETVNSADVYNSSSFDHISLVQFEIRISMNSEKR